MSRTRTTAIIVPPVLYRAPTVSINFRWYRHTRSPLFEDSYLAEVFETEGFPDTVEESANAIALARTSRELRRCYKVAVQLAMRKTVLLLQILKRHDYRSQERREKATTRLLKLRNTLETATSKLSNADRDVGLISSFVRRKGFPVEFGAEYRGRGSGIELDAVVGSDVPSPISSDFGVDFDEDEN